jgi:tetratricopeptide (TPR) repeat protein
MVAAEKNRIDRLSHTISLSIGESKIDEQIEHIDKFLKRIATRIFDLEAFINPLNESALSPDSELSKTLIRDIRRNPESFLEKISKKIPAAIFADDNTNKSIAECAKMFDCQQLIIRDILHPHFDFIKSIPKEQDGVKLFYARVFHLLHDQTRALALLASIDEENHRFDYLNLKANCYRKKKDFRQADTYYEMAFNAVKNSRDRAIYHHNQAMLVHESENPTKYQQALKHCQEAMKEWTSSVRFTRSVVNTLVLLEIAITPINDVHEKVLFLKLQFEISDLRLQNIFRAVIDKVKRMKLMLGLRQGPQ